MKHSSANGTTYTISDVPALKRKGRPAKEYNFSELVNVIPKSNGELRGISFKQLDWPVNAAPTINRKAREFGLIVVTRGSGENKTAYLVNPETLPPIRTRARKNKTS